MARWFRQGPSVTGPFGYWCLTRLALHRFHLPLVEPDVRIFRIHLIERLLTFGPDLGMPHTRAMGKVSEKGSGAIVFGSIFALIDCSHGCDRYFQNSAILHLCQALFLENKRQEKRTRKEDRPEWHLLKARPGVFGTSVHLFRRFGAEKRRNKWTR